MISVNRLRIEYSENPVGLGVRRPRFSWQLDGDTRDIRQSAYRIIVSDSHEEIQNNKGNIWDTKRVTTDESIHIEYKGLKLQSRQRYFWKVIVWDLAGGRSEWSEVAYWEMGILDSAEWEANWITSEHCAPSEETAPSPSLRREFEIGGEVKSARIYATALGTYELALDGQRIGDARFTPGWTSYNKRLQYQTYDVTDALTIGRHAIGATLADGWFRGRQMNFDATTRRNYYGDTLALLLQLHVEYADGRHEVIGSDDAWRSSTGGIRYADHYMGERFDARLEQVGWDSAEFDDSTWQPAQIMPAPETQLIAQYGPLVRQKHELAAQQISKTDEGAYLVDFGQNMVGTVCLAASGDAGTEITIRHGEVLDQDGIIYLDSLRSAEQKVVWTLRGDGEETYAPRFTFMGFRYVLVEGYPGELSAENISGLVLYSDLEETGTFTCSDPLINKLHENIVWSQRGNFLDLPTDCPQRDERLGWTGDALAFISTAAFNMNVATFFTRWLRDLVADQREDGAIPFVAPNVLGDNAFGAAAWSDAIVFCTQALYRHYGDKRIIRRNFSAMQRWVQYVFERAGDSLIWRGDFQFGDWLDIDHEGEASTYGRTDPDLLATAFFAASTARLAEMAAIIGQHDAAKSYEQLAAAIRAAFCAEFLTPRGRLSSDTQSAYVLSLAFDVLPVDKRPAAAQRLADNISANGMHLATGFVGTAWLSDVLTRFGFVDIAWSLMQETKYPSWLYEVLHDATTIWERWDGIRPNNQFQSADMNSFNHYANGAVGDWLYSRVAGLALDETIPGYKHAIIQPHPGGTVTNASASLETIYGPLSSSWEIDGEYFSHEVTIPANCSALLRLPVGAIMLDSEPLSVGNGLRSFAEIDQHIEILLGSGHYRFTLLSEQ